MAASWIGVALSMNLFMGGVLAMGVVMGGVALTAVLMTKLRLRSGFPFIAMPRAFLGATIYFGLFNMFMLAGKVSEDLLRRPFGAGRPNVAG